MPSTKALSGDSTKPHSLKRLMWKSTVCSRRHDSMLALYKDNYQKCTWNIASGLLETIQNFSLLPKNGNFGALLKMSSTTLFLSFRGALITAIFRKPSNWLILLGTQELLTIPVSR